MFTVLQIVCKVLSFINACGNSRIQINNHPTDLESQELRKAYVCS